MAARRHAASALVLSLVLGGVLVPHVAASAQERLLGTRSLGGGGYVERIAFGDDGVPQTAFAGLDSVRVRSAVQALVPVSATTALGERWRLDVTAFFATGRVRYLDAAGASERTATLQGVSDTRLRVTGRSMGDAFTMTLGLNIPTGRTSLGAEEFSALRVLAAPALGMGSSPVGAGASGTLGGVYARRAGPWALAVGASYEHRGSYQPVAALVAGAPSADFRPGSVVRASFGGERLVGAHRLSVTASADFFSDDRLRGVGGGTDSASAPSALATVKLGPVLSTDVQLLLAPGRLRELIVYTSYLWRAAYARDGRTAEGSSGQYLVGGMRGAFPLMARSDVIVAGEGRWQSGLAINEGLPTAGVRGASVTVGLSTRRGLVSFQPYVRAQGGVVRQRALQGATMQRPFTGLAAGLMLVSRY